MKQYLASLLLLVSAPPALAADGLTPAQFERLREVDVGLATIGYRLVTANAALCTDLTPATGLALHSLGQYPPGYRDGARRAFGFEAPVAVEGVVAGSPAAAAGIQPNDSLLAIDGAPLTATIGPATTSDARDEAQARIAEHPMGAPLRVTVLHDGRRRDVPIAAVPACRSSFEVLLGPALKARADGRVVQIGAPFFDRYDEAEVAAVVAHELAHNVLRHRVRLEAAGVHHGLFEELGKAGRLIRRTEDDADTLSVALLYNAGLDPSAAVRFWREHGGDVEGLFRSRTHASSSDRASAIQAAIDAIPAGAPRPYVPPVLATRDQPLS